MKIKARILNNTTLELLEDAKCGDTIDLNELVDIDLSFLNNKIQTEATSLYQKHINEKYAEKEKNLIENHNAKIASIKKENEYEKEKLLDNFKLEKDKLLSANEKDILNLTNSYELQIKDLNQKLNQKDKDLEVSLNKQKNEFEQEISNYKLQIKDNENTIKTQQLELDRKYKDEINELKNKNEILIKENEYKLLSTKTDYESKIKILETNIDNLKLQKSSLNVKKIGEELEHWCNEEYNNYALIGFNNCSFTKDNTSIKDDSDVKGTKADYIFTVYLDNKKDTILTNVCCEMKNEDPNSINKKKNSDHFAKLDKDRTKKGCEYALLVSELEWDSQNDAPIKVVNEYEKMYIVRPPYFISFLAIISSLANKYRDILLAKQSDELALKDKQEILEEFNNLLDTYINKPINSLNTKIEGILQSSEVISKANQKIIDTCNEIINKTINTIKEKINTLDIKKLPSLYKKLDKVNKE